MQMYLLTNHELDDELFVCTIEWATKYAKVWGAEFHLTIKPVDWPASHVAGKAVPSVMRVVPDNDPRQGGSL